MTMLRALGAEYGTPSDFDFVSGLSASSTSGKMRTGSYSYYFNNATGRVLLGTPETELYIQFNANIYNFGISYSTIFRWKSGSTVLGSLFVDYSTRVFKLYTGDLGTLVATGTRSLVSNRGYLLELRLKIDDADGVLNLRVDGIPDALFTGDTKPGAEGSIDTLEWFSHNSGSYTSYYADDIIVNNTAGSVNNSWPGGAKVILLKPNGAGSSAEWTPSAGSNYQNVDEVPPSTDDNNSTNTADLLDLFTLEDLPADAAAVQAILVDAWALKQGVTAVPNIKTAYKNSGGSVQLSSDHAVTLALVQASDIVEINPDTSSPFTPAEVNALEAGYKSAA